MGSPVAVVIPAWAQMKARLAAWRALCDDFKPTDSTLAAAVGI